MIQLSRGTHVIQWVNKNSFLRAEDQSVGLWRQKKLGEGAENVIALGEVNGKRKSGLGLRFLLSCRGSVRATQPDDAAENDASQPGNAPGQEPMPWLNRLRRGSMLEIRGMLPLK